MILTKRKVSCTFKREIPLDFQERIYPLRHPPKEGRIHRKSRDVCATRAELELLFHSTEVNRKLYLVLFDYVTLGARSERFRKLFHDFFENCRKRDSQIIAEGIELQEFRHVRPEDAAATIRALVDGYCLQWLMDSEVRPVESFCDRCGSVLGSYLLRG